MVSFVLPILFFIAGSAITWYVTHLYYKKSSIESKLSLIANRLDSCNMGEKTFLVALADYDDPFPLYALISIEYELHGGEKKAWSSNSCIMYKSLCAREPMSLNTILHSSKPKYEITFDLTNRGKENVSYLLKREIKWAKFMNVTHDEQTRQNLFKNYGYPPR